MQPSNRFCPGCLARKQRQPIQRQEFPLGLWGSLQKTFPRGQRCETHQREHAPRKGTPFYCQPHESHHSKAPGALSCSVPLCHTSKGAALREKYCGDYGITEAQGEKDISGHLGQATSQPLPLHHLRDRRIGRPSPSWAEAVSPGDRASPLLAVACVVYGAANVC